MNVAQQPRLRIRKVLIATNESAVLYQLALREVVHVPYCMAPRDLAGMQLGRYH